MRFDPSAILKKITVSHFGIPALIISLAFIYYGQTRIGISAVKDTDRNVFYVKKYFMLLIPAGSEKLTNIQKARFVTENNSDKELVSTVVLLSARFEHRIFSSLSDQFDEKKRNMYNDISFFLTDETRNEFSDSYVFTYKSGWYGYILSLLSVLFLIYGPKKSIAPAVEMLQKLIPEKQTRPKETKAEKKEKIERRKNGQLRVIISAMDNETILIPSIFDIPETGATALMCPENKKSELLSKFGDDYDYLICDGKGGTAGILKCAEEWLKDFNGYVIIQPGPIKKLTKNNITGFYKEHLKNDSDCTILTTECGEKKTPYGKVLRNVANRIIKISETEETNDSQGQTYEIFAGLLCFNTKNLYKVYNSLRTAGSDKAVDIVRMAEGYYKNGSRVNTFMISSGNEAVTHSAEVSQKQTPGKKSFSGIIISTEKFGPGAFRRSLEALNSVDPVSLCIITTSEFEGMIKELAGDESELLISNGHLGGADDVLKAYDKYKSFIGDIVVIPDTDNIISDNDLKHTISKHVDSSNVLTILQDPAGKVLFYCANSFQFFYAVKKVNRDEETGKYRLSGINEILINDKKRIQIISTGEID